jgi:dephospho-CoA kinase
MNQRTLLLLAGTSEAGKSTAGEYLQGRGLMRLKVREVLQVLQSGRPVFHEGIEMREEFTPSEFLKKLAAAVDQTAARAVVVESFIDAALARFVKEEWRGSCYVVFITASLHLRTQRLAEASGQTSADAGRLVQEKDRRKRVLEQLDLWRVLADFWIVNESTREAFLTALDEIVGTAVDSTYGGLIR